MKQLCKWLRPFIRQPSEAERSEADVSVKSDGDENSEYSDESSFNWLGIDQADSSIFDSGSQGTERPEAKDSVNHGTPRVAADPEEDIGRDPYDTARLGITKK